DTTLPSNELLLRGVDLSQPTAPFKSAMRPSSPVPDAIVTRPQMRAAAPIQRARFFMTKTPIATPPRHQNLVIAALARETVSRNGSDHGGGACYQRGGLGVDTLTGAITCHASYPLNSENAMPFGDLMVNRSSAANVMLTTKMDAATITTAEMCRCLVWVTLSSFCETSIL